MDMRRYGRELTMNAEVDSVLEEIDSDDLLVELLGRPDVSELEPDKMRKLICKLMGLPEWYHSDKDGLCREILKLF
jgi:hypothetical protein